MLQLSSLRARWAATAVGVAVLLGATAAPAAAFAAPTPTASAPAPSASATPEPDATPLTASTASPSPEPTTVDTSATPGVPSYTATGAGDAISRTTIYAGTSEGALEPVETAGPTASKAGVPYRGSLTLSPTEITNYDFFASGITLTATGLASQSRAIITDTSPSGDVYTFDAVHTDWSGSVTTTVRRSDRVDPEVGLHLIEIVTEDGSMAGARLNVTLSERLNAKATATPDRVDADQFHDEPIIIEGSGFFPNEWLTVHILTPDGDMSLVADDQMADADGTLRYVLQAATAANIPGPWQLTILGMESNRNGVANFFVDPSPDNAIVGTFALTSTSITTAQFADPGLGVRVTDLPPFGLYDMVLDDANNREQIIGRFRADGDGVLAATLFGKSAPVGRYGLHLFNVDNADEASVRFDVTAEDGSLPPAPTLTVTPSTIDVRDLMDTGLHVVGTGYKPGDTVVLSLRDKFRQKMRLSAESIAGRQVDESGTVSFDIRSFDAPTPGTWELAVGNPYSSELIQRTTIQITDAAAPTPTPAPSPAPTDSTGSAPAGGTSPDASSFYNDLTGSSTSRSWFVRTTGEGALSYDVDAQGTDALNEPVADAAQRRADDISETLDGVAEAAHGLDDEASVLYKAVWTVPGVALHMDDAAAAKLAERSDVVSVTPIATKELVQPVTEGGSSTEPANAASDSLTGALQTWTSGGKFTGKGTHIAVIDTGVDYTHAAFGGPAMGGRYWAMSGRFYGNMMPPAGVFYDPSKIEQGWDFAGALYSAGGGEGGYHPIPVPDSNPIDGPGGGHGTHVAATAAGWGVNADGTTFRGDFTQLTADEIAGMKVAPGSAPEASVIPLKVFGDFGGATDLAGAALDWVGGQVAAGRPIDVVNMSLGSSFSAPDDPENDLVAALTAQGVVVAIAAGNAGDVTDVGGSPGNSKSALTVGAIASGAALLDGVEALAPSDVAGVYGGQFSAERNPYPPMDVSAPVAALTEDDRTGCTEFSDADKAAVEGKIVWLEWDEKKLDNGTQCGSAVRFDNAEAAGAVGVLLTSTVDQFQGGIAGNADLPGAQLTHAATEKLRPALAAGTLAVRLADERAATIDAYSAAYRDTVAPFTSRGVHGSVDDIIKPDVSGPGVNVISAHMGTGNGSTSMSGTSMATPHTAGIVALVAQAHPDWSALRIKTAIMNTATHVVTDGAGSDVSPLRVGAGRVDAVQATTTDVTVASTENGDLVSASFGVVEVGDGGFTATRTLTLTSSADVDRTYAIGYDPRTETPGAAFSLSAGSVTVPAGGTATVTLTLSIPDAGALRRTVDPGTEQTTDTHITDISGAVTFTPADGTSPLWLTAFAAPKPVSSVAASDVTFDADATTATMSLLGDVVTQGEGDAAYHTRVTPLIAGATSPVADESTVAPHTLAGADIVRVGASSTAPSAASPSAGRLAIGAQLAAPLVSLGATTHVLLTIDANRDGRDDFVMVPQLTRTGTTLLNVYDNGTHRQVDQHQMNALSGSTVQWDNDTIVGSVDLARLGYTDTTKVTTMQYRVSTYSDYAPAGYDGSHRVDRAEWTALDVFTPPVWFDTDAGEGDDAPLAVTDSASIVVHQKAPSAGELMLIGHDNATGSRTSTAAWGTAAAVTTTGIEVTTMPTKTHYAVGESLDTTGLVVSAVRSDGSRQALDATALTFEGFDSSASGARVITVSATVDGTAYTTVFQITVDDAATPTPTPTDPGQPGGGDGSGDGWTPSPGADQGSTSAHGPSSWEPRGSAEVLAKTGQDTSSVWMMVLLGAVATGLGAAVLIVRRRASRRS